MSRGKRPSQLSLRDRFRYRFGVGYKKGTAAQRMNGLRIMAVNNVARMLHRLKEGQFSTSSSNQCSGPKHFSAPSSAAFSGGRDWGAASSSSPSEADAKDCPAGRGGVLGFAEQVINFLNHSQRYRNLELRTLDVNYLLKSMIETNLPSNSSLDLEDEYVKQIY